MNLKTFFTYQNLFQFNSAFISPQEKLFFFAGTILVLLAIVLKIAKSLAPNPIDVKYRQRFYQLFLWIGLLEIFWYLCRYENVQFFGTLFVASLIALIGAVWLVVILILALKGYKKEKNAWEKEQLKLKYLPK
jgi:hypothetical protein